MHIDLMNKTNGFTIARFTPDADSDTSHVISGTIHKGEMWDANGDAKDMSFFATVLVKWDGCSHFWFKGEDSQEHDKSEHDSYYHVCGIRSYIEHMRLMLFAYEIMLHTCKGNVLDFELKDYDGFKSLGLLDDYELVFR